MRRGDRVRILTGLNGGHVGVVTYTHTSWSTGRPIIDVQVECDDAACSVRSHAIAEDAIRVPLPYDVDELEVVELASVPLGA